jgi:NADH:ubiquinone oxidoreductase subunit F (NADH-binding)
MEMIELLKKHNLLGRGGAGFPVWQKWQMVLEQKTLPKYIICNGSEGEPGVFKDGFILENYPDAVINGIKLALKAILGSSAYLYLKKNYYEKFKKSLEKLIGDSPITLFGESGGYLGGEETTLLNIIEQKRKEPRIRPPFPPQSGLFGRPTLINNVETFYFVSKIAKGEYKNTRFYSISGDVKNGGVFELPINYSIEQVLKETNDYPDFEFFIQSGGGASGEILTQKELTRPVCGAGAIIVFDKKKTSLLALMQKWADFFTKENCDKCVPCREGTFRIKELLAAKKIDRDLLLEIIFTLKESSFCALGKSAAIPFESLLNKVYLK